MSALDDAGKSAAFTRLIETILAAGPALDEAWSLSKHEAAVKRRIDALTASEEQLKTRCAELRREEAAAKQALVKAAEHHEAHVAHLTTEADKVRLAGDDYVAKKVGEGAAVLKAAQDQVPGILVEADAKAARIVRDAVDTSTHFKKEIALAQDELSKLKREIEERKQALLTP